MRTFLAVGLLAMTACSGSGTTGGGAGGSGGSSSGGGSGGSGGGGAGGSGEMPMPCTPAGFTTAPAAIDHLPVTGITNASDHQAYAKWVVKDGGASQDVRLTVEDFLPDGGNPNVPAVTVRFNGCDLGAGTTVLGVGKEFKSEATAVWQITVDRFLTFEVVGATGTLLYRSVYKMPPVLPKVLSVTTPGGPMAKVDWTPIPDAGVTDAYVFGWRKFGGGGLQSVGFSNVVPASGTVNLTLSQAAQLFTFEVKASKIRLSSDFDVP